MLRFHMIILAIAHLGTTFRINNCIGLKRIVSNGIRMGKDDELSLINILNLAQESGFRLTATKLRDNFVKVFSSKYNSKTITLESDDDVLSKEAEMLSQFIREELKNLQSTADDIVFYNEPLSRLENMPMDVAIDMELFGLGTNKKRILNDSDKKLNRINISDSLKISSNMDAVLNAVKLEEAKRTRLLGLT